MHEQRVTHCWRELVADWYCFDIQEAKSWKSTGEGFLKTAGAGVGAAGLALGTAGSAQAAPLTEKEKLARLASNTWPIRYIFKSRTGFGRNPKNEAAKTEIRARSRCWISPSSPRTHFPGVTHMDLFSGLFGDVDRRQHVRIACR